jgi:hypothetical protein
MYRMQRVCLQDDGFTLGRLIAFRGYFGQFKDGYNDIINVYIDMRNTIGQVRTDPAVPLKYPP